VLSPSLHRKGAEVTLGPEDATNDALVSYFETVAGRPRPDWDEYRQAMIDQGRLLARFTPSRAVGQIDDPS